MFMPGDKVKYVGDKIFTDAKGVPVNLATKVGEVVARVSGEPYGYVVEIGDDSYIMSGHNLARQYFAPGAEPSAPKRRRDEFED